MQAVCEKEAISTAARKAGLAWRDKLPCRGMPGSPRCSRGSPQSKLAHTGPWQLWPVGIMTFLRTPLHRALMKYCLSSKIQVKSHICEWCWQCLVSSGPPAPPSENAGERPRPLKHCHCWALSLTLTTLKGIRATRLQVY